MYCFKSKYCHNSSSQCTSLDDPQRKYRVSRRWSTIVSYFYNLIFYKFLIIFEFYAEWLARHKKNLNQKNKPFFFNMSKSLVLYCLDIFSLYVYSTINPVYSAEATAMDWQPCPQWIRQITYDKTRRCLLNIIIYRCVH